MAGTVESTRGHTAVHNIRLPFAELTEAGAYINEKTGTLYRVPEEALVTGRSPLIEIVGNEPTMMTKISDNAWVPISRARQLAADADLFITF